MSRCFKQRLIYLTLCQVPQNFFSFDNFDIALQDNGISADIHDYGASPVTD